MPKTLDEVMAEQGLDKVDIQWADGRRQTIFAGKVLPFSADDALGKLAGAKPANVTRLRRKE